MNNKWFLKGGRGSGKTFRLLCETYENRIADLEKENAELEQENKVLAQNLEDTEIVNKALEKENVELEEWKVQTIKARRRDYMDWSRMKDDWNKMNDQLTKAKELIKNLLSAYTSYADSFDDRDNQIVEEAGQFISEVEK